MTSSELASGLMYLSGMCSSGPLQVFASSCTLGTGREPMALAPAIEIPKFLQQVFSFLFLG
uniref:Uncharacterized protein n=1 Tax=Oryza glumipatula TaxID=40148 RepID=A0A0E0BDN2_9ORYZ